MCKYNAKNKKRESNFDDYDGHVRKKAGKGKSTRILNEWQADETYYDDTDFDFDYDTQVEQV